MDSAMTALNAIKLPMSRRAEKLTPLASAGFTGTCPHHDCCHLPPAPTGRQRAAQLQNLITTMGLDITYYKNLTPAPSEAEDAIQLYDNPSFPGRSAGIDCNANYIAESSGGFRAGSYSGYNTWREELAKFAGYPAVAPERAERGSSRHDSGAWQADGGPFWELINFSDCEGTIGPIASAKLAKDFAENQSRADEYSDPSWRQLYTAWRTAFETAAKNGAVSLH